jgi:uncharacterized protein (TIGR00251 family)
MARAEPGPGPGLDEVSSALSAHPQGTVLNLIVTPRSGVTAFAGVEGDALRLRVAAPPVDGAANAALIRFLADCFDVPKSAVRMLSGETGRRKRVLVEGLMPDVATIALRSLIGN